ncbi:MAG: coproporphyrinogen-III oxidase family protein [Kofleriaceae bacterium]
MDQPSPSHAGLGVYVHFPWCRRLCPYCDFPVVVATEPPHRAYLAEVLAELSAQAPLFAGRRLATIYLGGGTPSWWDPACVAELIAAIRARFPGVPAEVTVEANPIDCTAPRMAAWRAAGVTRLSIGVQSWADAELTALGRDHRMGDGPAAIAAATAAGFAAVSADLILGAPGVAPPADGAAPASVHAAIASGVDHLSVYELTIEDRTAFGARHRAGRLPVLGDDAAASLYEATHHALTGAGFEHYEVSSYARPGRRAIHNAAYWRGGEFLGLGVGAASFRRRPDGGGERWHNHRQLERYRDADDRIAEHASADAAEVARDLLWLGMRTSDGVAVEAVAPTVTAWATAAGLATIAHGRLRPTLRGFLCANQLAARLVAER